MLELVIFDMDGLMFATEQVNCRAFMEVVKEEGYHPTFEQFTSFLGMNARDIQKKYYDYYGEDTDAEGIYKKVGSRAKQIINAVMKGRHQQASGLEDGFFLHYLDEVEVTGEGKTHLVEISAVLTTDYDGHKRWYECINIQD